MLANANKSMIISVLWSCCTSHISHLNPYFNISIAGLEVEAWFEISKCCDSRQHYWTRRRTM